MGPIHKYLFPHSGLQLFRIQPIPCGHCTFCHSVRRSTDCFHLKSQVEWKRSGPPPKKRNIYANFLNSTTCNITQIGSFVWSYISYDLNITFLFGPYCSITFENTSVSLSTLQQLNTENDNYTTILLWYKWNAGYLAKPHSFERTTLE